MFVPMVIGFQNVMSTTHAMMHSLALIFPIKASIGIPPPELRESQGRATSRMQQRQYTELPGSSS
jgi:hypothetical protein